MLHFVIFSCSWLRLGYSERSIVFVHCPLTFILCMVNCFGLFLLLDIVFGCSFETLCHFVTKRGSMFEFTLMSLIEGVILIFFDDMID
jgi:hypothetical protein